MLDADRRAAMWIRPTRDISGSEHGRHAGLQPAVDQHASIQGDPAALGEFRLRLDPDPRDDEIRVEGFALGNVTRPS